MVYSLQKFYHYLLGGHFKFFTNRSALKYMVNKLVFKGMICIRILLFQEFTFKVIVKPRRMNVGSGHLCWMELGEVVGLIDEQLSNVDLFRVEAILDYLEDIALFLTTDKFLEEYITT